MKKAEIDQSENGSSCERGDEIEKSREEAQVDDADAEQRGAEKCGDQGGVVKIRGGAKPNACSDDYYRDQKFWEALRIHAETIST
jgi:hypothetical protein